MLNLKPAHEKARYVFSKMNPHEVAKRAEVRFDDKNNVFYVQFIGKEYLIGYPKGDVTLNGGGEPALIVKVCLLHYLTKASGVKPTGRYISFKELPNGSIYVGPYYNRAIKPLVSLFGKDPQMLVDAGEKLGGQRVELGDYAITVKAFPKIPITFVIWEGDDEFEASGNILYDDSAGFHLETEDYALLPGLILAELKKMI